MELEIIMAKALFYGVGSAILVLGVVTFATVKIQDAFGIKSIIKK